MKTFFLVGDVCWVC